MSVVLDASALLAYLQREPGHDKVGGVLDQSVISTVNWAEVIGVASTAGVDTEGLLQDIEALGLVLEPFSPAQAESAGRLLLNTRHLGLSLGDRACLALGLERDSLIYTADRTWLKLHFGVDIKSIRP